MKTRQAATKRTSPTSHPQSLNPAARTCPAPERKRSSSGVSQGAASLAENLSDKNRFNLKGFWHVFDMLLTGFDMRLKGVFKGVWTVLACAVFERFGNDLVGLASCLKGFERFFLG